MFCNCKIQYLVRDKKVIVQILKNCMKIYTESKVKHHLNIFQEKTMKPSKYEFILVTLLKRDQEVRI